MIELTGLDEVTEILKQIGGKKSMNLMRNTMRGIAVEIAKEAKKRVPVESKNLKKSIKVRSRRAQKNKSVFMVYFTSGKNVRNDGFYWRFVEHGTVKQRAKPFLQPSIDLISNNLGSITNKVFSQKLEQMINRELKNQAKQ